MTYSIVTLGGEILKSGLTESGAVNAKNEYLKEFDAPNYYKIKEDEIAEKIEASPSLEEILNVREVVETTVINPVTNRHIKNMTPDEIKTAEINYDNLQNEGFSDGYNPYR